MRGLIVGFGYIAEGHLFGYRSVDGLTPVAAVDISAARRDAAQRHGLRAFASIDQALEAADIDFIDVCTPPSLHLRGIRAAVAAGLPVLCEKPVFVPGGSSYDDVLDHIGSGGSLVYPCQNYKFAPIFARVRRILEAGAVGEVQHARVDIARHGHARGVADWQPDWRRDAAYSAGGILRDHGPHATYLLTSLLERRPVEVSALIGSLADSPADSRAGGSGSEGTEDTGLLRLRGEAFEAQVSLTWAAGHRSSRYLLAGTQGFVCIENDSLTWSSSGRVVHEPVRSDFDDPSHSAWFADMFRDFQRLVRSASPTQEAMTLAGESLDTTAVIDAGYESAGLGGAWRRVADLRPLAWREEDARTA